MSRRVLVGEIVAPFGVRGWVKVRTYTDSPENVLRYRPWLIECQGEGEAREIVPEEGRIHGPGVVVRLKGVDDRNAAERLSGTQVLVPREVLPAVGSGTYYWADLIGLRVMTDSGIELGVVSGLMETGANDVLIVKGDRERLVPFVLGQYVTAVELDEGRLSVDWDPDF